MTFLGREKGERDLVPDTYAWETLVHPRVPCENNKVSFELTAGCPEIFGRILGNYWRAARNWMIYSWIPMGLQTKMEEFLKKIKGIYLIFKVITSPK
jgi:hypothetical protein